YLHSAPGAAAVIHQVPHPLQLALRRSQGLIPVDAERLTSSRILAVVRHVSLACEDILAPVAVQICQGECMRLRPAVVDDVPGPLAAFALLEPEDAVVVRVG